MLTIFSTPKPFVGHINIIQRNAIQSWQRLHPDAEIILFGPEEGAAETAREFGIRHEPRVDRNEHGTKLLASFFNRAEDLARHPILCYVNCDIILTGDLVKALERAQQWQPRFMMAGQRWDLDVREPIDFGDPAWGEHVRKAAIGAGQQRPPQWIDYFVYPRGLYQGKIPEFVIGRPGWDNWLLWWAEKSGLPVIDASDIVIPVHQNHDYSYHPDGEQGVWQGEEARRNYALLGGGQNYRRVEDATHRLAPDGVDFNYRRWWTLGKRAAAAKRSQAWFAVLDATRPLRHRLGLKHHRAPDSPAKHS